MTTKKAAARPASHRARARSRSHPSKPSIQELPALAQVVQQIPGFGVFWKDKNSIYLGCNESFARIAGARNPAAIVGKNDFELGCSREEAEEFRRVDREVIRTGKTVLNMREVAHGRKRATHLRTHKTPLRDGRGKIIGVLGITEDITNSAEMEGALRQKERELEALLNHLPDLAWLKDTQSRFILVNESFAEKCGRRPESLKGKTDLDVWPRKLAEGYRAADRQVIREGKTLRMEEELETTDKSRTWIETIKAPIRDGRGKIVGTVGIARDITEQKRWAERQLMIKDRAIETSMTAIGMRDLDGKWTYVNPAFVDLWGYRSADEIKKRAFHECFEPRQPIAQLLKTLRQNEKWSGELVAVRKDGSSFPVLAWFSLIRGEDRQPGLMMASFMEITDRKRAEQAILSAQKLESLSVLSGGIAHDFNNMLVGVLGNASLALRKLPENTEARRLVEEIMVSAQNASRLTSQLLAYSGKGRFVVQPLNLTLQAQKMERLLRMSIAGNANLKFDLDHEVPPINGDPAQVQQVIVNLVKNASEALEGKEGIITLCTGVRSLSRHPSQSPIAHYQIEPGRYAYIRVTDTGCGMPPKISEKAFEPFFSTKFTGRGLGLAAVQGIVLSHCGAIQYDSKVGRGTTFEVFFPVADGVVSLPSRIAQRFERRPEEQDRDQEREHVRGHEKESKQSMKNLSGTVLIVDDEQVVRTVASHILDEFGLKILTAESGPKAVEIYKKSGPEIDVVLLDMTMPGMNGVETFKELKKINPKVRVILTSGYSADEVQLNFDQGELAGFLEKPFTAQALSEKIGEALET